MNDQTPSPLRAELDTLIRSPEYRDPFHKNYQATQEKVQGLYSRLYPKTTEAPGETGPEQQTKQPHAPQQFEGVPATEVETVADLKREWGSSWEANVAAAQGVVQQLNRTIGFDVEDFLEDSGLGSHPLVLRAMLAWSRGEPGPEVSVEQAQALLAMATKTEIYRSGFGKTRDAVLDLVQGLYSIVYDVQEPRA
jgi:hypothetical protein